MSDHSYFSEWDAAYVLGALNTVERLEFEDHLSECAACSTAVAELAGMPGLLGILDANSVSTAVGEQGEALLLSARLPSTLSPLTPLPVTLLPRLVRATRRYRIRRRAFAGTVFGLSAAAIVVGILVVGGEFGPVYPSSHPSAAAERSTTLILASSVSSPLSATVTLIGEPWGTRLDASCSYAGEDVPRADHPAEWPGYTTSPHSYSLWVTARDGTQTEVASWTASPGASVNPTATTNLAKGDIAAVDIRDATSGAVVLRGSR